MTCVKCGKEEKEEGNFNHYDETDYICSDCDSAEFNVQCPHCDRYIAVN